jgi:glutamine synthetase
VLERDSVTRFVEEERIHSVELAVADSLGGLRGKRVPAEVFLATLDSGVALSSVLFVFDTTADFVPSRWTNLENGFPDVRIVPDLATMRALPWNPGTAFVICDCIDEERNRVEAAPRQILTRVVALARELGYEPAVGPELEFFLLDPETRRPHGAALPPYSLAAEPRLEPVVAAIRNQVRAAGIELEASNPEYAPGQYEVNIRHSGAVEAADATMLFRYAVKQIAAAHGLVATFMAKPFTELSGNGFHVHHSLWQEGSNAFAADSGEGEEPGAICRHFVAGLQRRIGELTLLGAPTPNAFKRRKPTSFAPVNATWGLDNRTVAIRVPETAGDGARVEQRDAAADANPYLVIAGQLAAGLEGVRHGWEPTPRTDANAYETGADEALPGSLAEAIARFRASEPARRMCGDVLHEILLALARAELDAYGDAVTEWERDRYLETA